MAAPNGGIAMTKVNIDPSRVEGNPVEEPAGALDLSAEKSPAKTPAETPQRISRAGSAPGSAFGSAIDPERYRSQELLTDRQIAEWLGCSPKSARSWLYRHKIDPADAPGRTKRYRAGDIQTALHRSRSGAEAA